ncbi:PQQ-binding-like beta-propeller repeat protein [Mycolicibacterium sp. 120270]|uniref:Rv3212 family protein n=1 Tax=Mycolicibacterium sp. 120270 TaxID=3090600 RepID=UPI00299DF99D|nr:PQQ-binding-like beta-propeller repeat protein [Mycolicibacterium sp. 120270]MDX1884027.1 PQQ-binding-like beta-propeller repeat protein [Mycolicibacterium sp. 120270]
MVKPERRTKADLMAAAAIAVAVAVVAALIWWTSDARATISSPAAAPVKTPAPAKVVPASLRELWTAPSPKTTAPVLAGGAVVTGDGRQVDGRDPTTGDVLWSYARDLELCGVTSVYNYAVAVYPDSRGCGQVSTIDGQTGTRGPSRTAYADREVALSTDGTTVLSAGENRLELWRSDMVRMISYGALDAKIKPDVPGPVLCKLTSAAASTSAVSVLEACPDQPDLRLTVLRPAKEEDTPDLKYVPLADVKDDSGARVVAVSETTTAVYVPTPRPSLMIIDETGSTTANLPLPKPASPEAAATRPGDLVTWWTGDAVLVFSASGMQYRYTVGPVGTHVPIGPATMMAGKLIIPVNDGIGVYDAGTGVNERYIPLRRKPTQSAVVPGVAGSVLLEQRGATLAALGG